jgi:hypothetical protein
MSEHEAQASEREHPRVSLKGSRVRPLHRETTTLRVLESQWFRSAEVGRTHRRSRCPNASHIARGTRDLARRTFRSRGDCARRSANRANRCGSWKALLLPEVRTSSRYYAQASSGSHPEGCGLGNSGSFRAASVVRLDSMEGCLGRGCVSLNRRRDCDPGFGGSNRSHA